MGLDAAESDRGQRNHCDLRVADDGDAIRIDVRQARQIERPHGVHDPIHGRPVPLQLSLTPRGPKLSTISTA